MPNDVNRVVLLGTLAARPMTRDAPTGAVVVLSIASRRAEDTAAGMAERVDWHDVVCPAGLAGAAAAATYEPGMRAYVEGAVRYRTQETPGGRTGWVAEVVAREAFPVGGDHAPHPDDPLDGSGSEHAPG